MPPPVRAETCGPEVMAAGTKSKYLPPRRKGPNKRREASFTLAHHPPQRWERSLEHGIYKESQIGPAPPVLSVTDFPAPATDVKATVIIPA